MLIHQIINLFIFGVLRIEPWGGHWAICPSSISLIKLMAYPLTLELLDLEQQCLSAL